ncbi:MAG: hypothetical protein NPIRA01_26730 [Nitrospirales bacterium]|nr:MAG: hypothetical protein NPIRA01_26730 [Nitrospirales bacterium]
MQLFIQLFPTDVQVLIRNAFLISLLFITMILPIMIAEGCVKRPSLEPTPGVAPQQDTTP